MKLRPLMIIAAALLAQAPVARSAEVLLKAANAFPPGTYYSKNFESFVKRVNEEGKGLVRINYIGGPQAIPTFEIANALRAGVIDVANTTASFTAALVPEAVAFNYTDKSMAQMRAAGALDYINRLYEAKGLHYYARAIEGGLYYVYTSKPTPRTALAGLKLRSSPLSRDFLIRVGATPLQIAPGEVYTALERGVADGYMWPLMGIFDLGWQEMTKYRIEPGFYQLESGVVFSAQNWKRLSPEQRAFLEKQATILEREAAQTVERDTPAELTRQQSVGVKVIRMSDAESKAVLKIAYDSAWDGLVQASPQHGKVLRDMLAPK